MQKEDPLERIEREAREKRERRSNRTGVNGGLRFVMWALILVVVALAAVLWTVWSQKTAIVDELTTEKQELTERIEILQNDYATLSSDNELISSQLDSSREAVSQLVAKIKSTEATNRAKMRQYEKELGTLRSIMRNYIVQIDSLNNLNHKLTAQASAARKEAAESKRQNAKLTSQVEDLTSKVTAGSILKARGMRLEAFGTSDKKTDRSGKVVRMMVTLSLVENGIAEHGPVCVYVCIKDPSGKLIQDPSGTVFTFEGETVPASACRVVDYEGSEVEMSIYVNGVSSYTKGVYTAEAYTEQAKLGTAEILLR